MQIPSYLLSSLDLLPVNERKHAVNAIIKMEAYERDLQNNRKYFIKLIGSNRYLFRVSLKYRAIVEIEDNEIKLLNIVHHDKIHLAIQRGMK